MRPEAAAALVLSAGFSERMGGFKPLMTLGGMSLLERVIRLFQSAAVHRIHVVIGHRAAELAPLVHRLGADGVVNENYAEGMFSSVETGLSRLDKHITGFFVLPVDIPLVRTATLRDLLHAMPDGGDTICYPTFAGRRGHPPLIGGRHAGNMLNLRLPGGLRAALGRLESHARDVAVVDEFIHQDMDHPEDYRRLAERMQARSALSPAECEALLTERLHAAPAIIAHGRAVADVAVRIGGCLSRTGSSLDLALIRAAALVHDMARGMPNHAGRGADILRELDMPQMADIVETHMDLSVEDDAPISEAEVVFLADKLVVEDRFVGLADRFDPRLAAFKDNPAALAGARRRMDAAHRSARRIETAAGRPLESLLHDPPIENRWSRS